MSPSPGAKVSAGFLAGYLTFNLAASFCFKEGGTSPAYHWAFFVGGNILGITSTWFVMRLYQHLNVNVAMALTFGLGFVSVQLAYWRIYHSPLDLRQWGGIALVLVGTLMAAWSPGSVKSATSSVAAGEA